MSGTIPKLQVPYHIQVSSCIVHSHVDSIRIQYSKENDVQPSSESYDPVVHDILS